MLDRNKEVTILLIHVVLLTQTLEIGLLEVIDRQVEEFQLREQAAQPVERAQPARIVTVDVPVGVVLQTFASVPLQASLVPLLHRIPRRVLPEEVVRAKLLIDQLDVNFQGLYLLFYSILAEVLKAGRGGVVRD